MTPKEMGDQLYKDCEWFVTKLKPQHRLDVFLSVITRNQQNDDYSEFELTVESDSFVVAHKIGSGGVTLFGSDGLTEIKEFEIPPRTRTMDVIKNIVNNQLK